MSLKEPSQQFLFSECKIGFISDPTVEYVITDEHMGYSITLEALQYFLRFLRFFDKLLKHTPVEYHIKYILSIAVIASLPHKDKQYFGIRVKVFVSVSQNRVFSAIPFYILITTHHSTQIAKGVYVFILREDIASIKPKGETNGQEYDCKPYGC